VNIFGHENSGQRNGVFSGIVDDMEGVKYLLKKGMKVGAGPEQSGVGISSRYLRDVLSLTTITPGVAKPLHVRCPIIQ
jgi:hypothetical protein